MKSRGGFTFVELLIAGAILSTIAFGALIGITRISGFVDQRSDLMAADGFCWDLAWSLFNNYNELNWYLHGACDDATGLPAYPRPVGDAYFEIKGEVTREGAVGKECDFLPHLQYPGSPPVCYITLSNRCDEAGNPDYGGIFISVNLEWGPQGRRRILTRRRDTPADVLVYDHPVTVFRSKFARGR